jgi:hypothetical protein
MMRKIISVLYKYEGWGYGSIDTRHATCEILAATSSRPNSKVLPVRVVLAHTRTMFLLHTCELCRGTAAVAATLIGYDDVEVAVRTVMWWRRS